MLRYLCFVLFCLVLSCRLSAALPVWDAVPAIDVMHLQGAYAGREVCPMCQHGYDAGILAFLPSSTSPALARRISEALRSAAAEIHDGRFRTFLIFTGTNPSAALLETVKSPNPEWYVAHLDSTALKEASRKFGIELQHGAYALVFSQRRLVWAFDPVEEISEWEESLGDFSRYAIQFLQSNYPEPSASNDPDVAKGRLWLAPEHLSSRISFAPISSRTPLKACFMRSAGEQAAHSLLISLHPNYRSSPQRVLWARSDSNGCVMMNGLRELELLRVEIFEQLRAPWTTSIDIDRAKDANYIDVSAEPIMHPGVTGKEIISSQPCEGCEGVFVGLPSQLSSTARIAPVIEPGEPLRLSGIVENFAGIPQSGVIIYAYQTDASGHYPTDDRLSGDVARHGRLRAWAKTDENGRYTFQTIRPGAYPGRSTPRHIHLHVIEPGRCTYYLGDVMFSNDPLLTDTMRQRERNAIGGSGIVSLEGSAHSGWRATRDITLGLNLQSYGRCQTQIE